MLKVQGPQGLADLPHFAALRHRDFRNTWFAGIFSSASLWTFVAAATWMVQEESNAIWVGVIVFSSMIPFLVVSPFAGLMADRLDRRNLAFTASAAGAVVAATLAGLALSGALQIWHVAILAFVAGSMRATQEPAIQSLVPNQVPRELLLNAITLTAATRHGPRFLGLVVAATLWQAGLVDVVGVLVMSAVFQGLSAVFMLRTHTVSKGEARGEQRILRSMVDGLAYIYSHQTIAVFVIMVAFHCALVMSFDSMLPVFTQQSLGADDGWMVSYIMMGFGGGSLLATLMIAGIRSERRKGQMLLITGLVSGVAPVLLALSGNLPMAVGFGAAMGASQATFMALTNTYVQSIAPDRLRGRIASLYVLHAGGIMAFANLGFGFFANAFSAPPVLITTGILFVVVMLGLWAGQPILRRVYSTGQLAAA